MNATHKTLAAGRWQSLSFFEQMANIGSEVERTISWKNRGNNEYGNRAFERVLELLWFTIDDSRNRTHSRLKELTRVREALIDHFAFDNNYRSSDTCWQKYFFQFTYAANLRKYTNN